jgi:hypothetical protein
MHTTTRPRPLRRLGRAAIAAALAGPAALAAAPNAFADYGPGAPPVNNPPRLLLPATGSNSASPMSPAST